MKHVLNFLLILATFLNPLVSFQSSASTPLQPQAQVAATPTVQPGLNGAYPAPATPTPLPTATRVAPTPTLQPTAAPTATPTVTPTSKPAKQPKPEGNLPPGLAKKVANMMTGATGSALPNTPRKAARRCGRPLALKRA